MWGFFTPKRKERGHLTQNESGRTLIANPYLCPLSPGWRYLAGQEAFHGMERFISAGVCRIYGETPPK